MDLIGTLRRELDDLKAAALVNTGAIDANGQRITNLSSPQANSDAATAGYVRSYVAAQLESFKGQAAVDGTFITADVPPKTVTVQDGLITEMV